MKVPLLKLLLLAETHLIALFKNPLKYNFSRTLVGNTKPQILPNVPQLRERQNWFSSRSSSLKHTKTLTLTP